MHTYKSLQKEKENWIILEFRIPLRLYLLKFKGRSSGFPRYLSNGQNRFIGTSNRSFWKNIKTGFYRFFFERTHIHFVYFLNIDEVEQKRFSIELIIRIKRIINCKVEIIPFENMTEIEKIILSSPNGFLNYKKIKS
jgi:hypothetical protein